MPASAAISYDAGGGMSDSKAGARDGGNFAEVFCRPLPYSARSGTQVAPAQQSRQVAGVDADRAGGGTEAAAGAGVEAVIDKIGFDVGWHLRRPRHGATVRAN